MAEWEIVDSELDSPSASGAVVPLSGGRALLTGVHSFDRKRVELYDPSTTPRFTRVADALSPLRWHFAVTLKDDRVLVGGGGDFTDRTRLRRRCYIYNPPWNPPPNDFWVEVAPLPHRSFWMYTKPAALLPDGRVIVTGGSTPDEAYFDPVDPGDPDAGFDVYIASRNVFIFNPPAIATSLPGSWETREPMPSTHTFSYGPPHEVSVPGAPVAGIVLGKTIEAGRAAHATVVLPNGNVMLIGGRQYQPGEFYGVKWVDQYDPDTNTWNAPTLERPELPSVPADNDLNYGGRGFPAVALLSKSTPWGSSNRVLIAGGYMLELVEEPTSNGDFGFNVRGTHLPRGSTLLFDPSTDVFETVDERLSFPRPLPLAAPLDSSSWWQWGSRAVVIGGESTYEGAAVYHAERFFHLTSYFHNWKTLPCEPYPTWPDYSPRMGTALTDGSILTWSSVDYTDEPEFGGSGALRVAKRLHLSWWE